MASAIDLFFVYQFIKGITTRFDETDAYELGLIDENGKKLADAEQNQIMGLPDEHSLESFKHQSILLLHILKVKPPGVPPKSLDSKKIHIVSIVFSHISHSNLMHSIA